MGYTVAGDHEGPLSELLARMHYQDVINEWRDLQCWRCDQRIEPGENFHVLEMPERRPGARFPTCIGCVAQLVSREAPPA